MFTKTQLSFSKINEIKTMAQYDETSNPLLDGLAKPRPQMLLRTRLCPLQTDSAPCPLQWPQLTLNTWQQTHDFAPKVSNTFMEADV